MYSTYFEQMFRVHVFEVPSSIPEIRQHCSRAVSRNSVLHGVVLSRNSPYCRETPARSGYWKLYCQEIGLRCQEMSRNTCRETVRKMQVSRNSTAVSRNSPYCQEIHPIVEELPPGRGTGNSRVKK